MESVQEVNEEAPVGAEAQTSSSGTGTEAQSPPAGTAGSTAEPTRAPEAPLTAEEAYEVKLRRIAAEFNLSPEEARAYEQSMPFRVQERWDENLTPQDSNMKYQRAMHGIKRNLAKLYDRQDHHGITGNWWEGRHGLEQIMDARDQFDRYVKMAERYFERNPTIADRERHQPPTDLPRGGEGWTNHATNPFGWNASRNCCEPTPRILSLPIIHNSLHGQTVGFVSVVFQEIYEVEANVETPGTASGEAAGTVAAPGTTTEAPVQAGSSASGTATETPVEAAPSESVAGGEPAV